MSLTAHSGAQAPQGIPGTTTPSATSPSYVSSYSSASDPAGNSNGNGFSNQFGAYAVQASAEGNALAFGRSGLGYVITNTSSVAQQVTMSFYVYGGSMLSALDFGFTGALDSGEYLESTYLARILVENNPIWSSGAIVRRDSNGVQITTSGTTLTGAAQDDINGSYSWLGAYYSVELGVLAAGESFDVVTELAADARANVGSYIYDGGGGGYCGYDYGYGCECPPEVGVQGLGVGAPGECETTRFKGFSNVFYGDPVSFGFEGSAGEDGSVASLFRLSPVGTVALPSTIWLAGLAVAGLLAHSARRRAR